MSEYDTDELTTIQGVVDRVSAYQDGAEEGFVAKELRNGFDEAGIEVAPEHIEALATAIDDEDGNVDAANVLA